MTKQNSSTPAGTGETHLRGKELTGSEQQVAVDHVAYDQKRNPDAVVRTDGEKDTLYDDGLDVDGDGDTLFGTQNVNNGS